MSRSLVDRYTYGNSEVVREIVYETPRRDRQMIQLAERQIEAQNDAAQEIAISNIVGARIIASEIVQQTQAMERTANEFAGRMSDSILFAADKISDAISILGDRLCVELSEINWQLAQQNETLEEILNVLRNSRNNEAQQFVKQGVRHYVSGEYKEAEERFRLALGCDTTDYQVLMNLAYIEIHKDNASEAFTFLKKAVSLPENLDSASKSRTLWATARLYYAERDYTKAFLFAEQAFNHDNQDDPKRIYTVGIYATLAGKKTIALERIERSILIDPAYFSKCAVDPDLEVIKQDILKLLSRLSIEAESRTRQAVNLIAEQISEIEKEPSGNNDFNVWVKKQLNKAEEGMKKPSYSFCLRCADNMNILKEAILLIKNLIPLYSKKLTYQKDFNNKNERYLSIKKSEPISPEYFNYNIVNVVVYGLLLLIMYILIGCWFTEESPIGSHGKIRWDSPDIVAVIIWPLLFVFVLFGAIFNSEAREVVVGCFKRLFIAAVVFGITAIINILIETLLKNHNEDRRREFSNYEKQMNDAKNAVFNIQNEITDIQNEIISKENKIKENLVNISW